MGQKSTIDRLPKDLREKLIKMLQDPAVTQLKVVGAINESAGYTVLSKSALNRYANRMRRIAEKRRQAQEIAETYLEKIGADNSNKLGKVVNEIIRLTAFDLMSEVDSLGDESKLTPEKISDIVYKVSRALRDLEYAEKLNAERSREIRKSALSQAAAVVEKEGTKAGFSKKGIKEIRTKIMGLER